MPIELEVVKYGARNFRKNIKSYFLASVIIITTLTAILLMLGLNDIHWKKMSQPLNTADDTNYYYFSPSDEKLLYNEQKFLLDIENLDNTIVIEKYTMYYQSEKYSNGKNITFESYFIDSLALKNFFVHNTLYFPKVISGSLEFTKLNQVILTEASSLIMFGTTDVIGKSIEIDFVNHTTFESKLIELEVIGVIDTPEQYKSNFDESEYVTLQFFMNNDQLEEDFFVKAKDQMSVEYHIYTTHEKLVDGYAVKNSVTLGTSLMREKLRLKNIRVTQVENQLYSLLAIFLVVCANVFASIKIIVNARRKEIGIQRAIGASKFQIIQQYLSEYFIFYFMCVLISVLIYFAAMFGYITYMSKIGEYYSYYLSTYSMFTFLSITGTMILISSIIILISVDVKVIDSIKSE